MNLQGDQLEIIALRTSSSPEQSPSTAGAKAMADAIALAATKAAAPATAKATARATARATAKATAAAAAKAKATARAAAKAEELADALANTAAARTPTTRRRHSPKGQAVGWIEERLGNLQRKNPCTSFYFCWQEGDRRQKTYIPNRHISTVAELVNRRRPIAEVLQAITKRGTPHHTDSPKI